MVVLPALCSPRLQWICSEFQMLRSRREGLHINIFNVSSFSQLSEHYLLLIILLETSCMKWKLPLAQWLWLFPWETPLKVVPSSFLQP